MADTHFPDEGLAHSLEGVVTPELLVELREKAPPPARLWETLVAQKIASDEQILAALSTRFRLKLADLAHLDPAAKERVPEQVARRYHILPLRATDSYLEVATANPFDLDAEKALAFATAREIRMFLLAPSKIAERLDELYRPEKAVDKLLEGMENSTSLEHLQDTAPDELVGRRVLQVLQRGRVLHPLEQLVHGLLGSVQLVQPFRDLGRRQQEHPDLAGGGERQRLLRVEVERVRRRYLEIGVGGAQRQDVVA